MSIDISNPWARIQTVESGEAGGFLTLTNTGPEPDRLVAATSDAAEKVEIRGIKVVGAVLGMRLLEQGLRLPVGMPIELRPRGYHLLFQRLKAPLVRGQKVPVTLTFEKAGVRQLELVVKAEGLVGNDTLGVYKPEKGASLSGADQAG
jgi:periplasmic copper chaperone A